jgi:hypothetical protein
MASGSQPGGHRTPRLQQIALFALIAGAVALFIGSVGTRQASAGATRMPPAAFMPPAGALQSTVGGTFVPLPLTYHGGPVMRTTTTYTIFWLPSGYQFSAYYESLIDTYLQDVAAASGSTSNVNSAATQYFDTSGPVAYSSTFGGGWEDWDTFPASGCNDGVDAVCLTQAQMQAEIQRVINTEGWPDGGASLFLLMTPEGVGSCSDGSDQWCVGSSYCAYHTYFTGGNSQPVIWANEPYDALVSGCSGGNSNDPDAEATINTISHEMNEAITDPELNAWYGVDLSHEIGDNCSWNFGTALGSEASGQPYNQVINGHYYNLQQEWSNVGGQCVQNYPAVPLNVSLPTVSGVAVVGKTLSTSGGAWTVPPISYAYVWERCAAGGDGCTAIVGATASTYTLTSADAGQTIRARVEAADAAGSSAPEVSLPTTVVVGLPVNSSLPVISGKAKVGHKLTARPGAWSSSPTTYGYQWLRCKKSGTACKSIASAHRSSYVLAKKDGGHAVRVVVTADNAAGSATARSNARTVPAPAKKRH